MGRCLPVLLVVLSACARGGDTRPPQDHPGAVEPVQQHIPATTLQQQRLPNPGKTCPAGAIATPDGCIPLLPCGEVCGNHASCVATGRTNACVCDAGFQRKVGACVDVDECAGNPCGGDHTVCTNLPGTYQCSCAPGYGDRAPNCTDQNECLVPGACDANAYCRNEEGSYSCACRSGFLGDGKTCKPDHMDGFVRLRVGGDHACGLRADGSVWCWGGRYGLGAGDRPVGSSAVRLPGKDRFVDMDAGGAGGATDITVALREDGSLVSFGLDMQDLLLGAGPFQSVRVSLPATCAGETDSALTCEGPALEGRLHRQVTDYGLGPEDACFVWPDGSLDCTHPGTPPHGLWRTVATGHHEACGIRDDGGLYCWGLGRGSDVARRLGQDDDWIRVELGDDTGSPTNHHLGCGLRRGGKLSCFGQNLSGGAGNGDSRPLFDPVAVLPESGWVDFGVGRAHACGLRADGEVRCWGSNDVGQLGRGGAMAQPASESQVPGSWRAVDSGEGYACGIRTDGSLWCWGHAGAPWVRPGMFYDGASFSSPTLVDGGTWASVSVALWHACGLDSAGALYCWGDRLARGQSGISAEGVDLRPVPMAPGASFTEAWTGDFYGCARDATDTVVCWGALPDGRLAPSPTPITADWGFAQHLPASAAGCSLRSPDEVWCWGENDYGQRGDGSGFDPTPAPILWPVPME